MIKVITEGKIPEKYISELNKYLKILKSVGFQPKEEDIKFNPGREEEIDATIKLADISKSEATELISKLEDISYYEEDEESTEEAPKGSLVAINPMEGIFAIKDDNISFMLWVWEGNNPSVSLTASI